MCWMHVDIKNALPAIRKIPNLPDGAGEEAQKARSRAKFFLHEDFQCLHVCSEDAMFDAAIELFRLKYCVEHPDAAIRAASQTLYDSWCALDAVHRRWFAGACRGKSEIDR